MYSTSSTTTSERRKHRVKVPRKLDSNGNPLPHKHEHREKLHKHKNGQITFDTNAESTSAVSMYANSTDACTTLSIPTITQAPIKKKNGRKVHIDKYCNEFRGKPLHILDPLSDVLYDSANADDFARLENDENFRPGKMIKERSKFKGPHYDDSTLLSNSTIDTAPSVTTVESESNSYTSYFPGKALPGETYDSTSSSEDIPKERGVTQTTNNGSESQASEMCPDYNLLAPKVVNNELFDQYEEGTAITKIEDIVFENIEPTVDEEFEPEEPRTIYTYKDVYISATTQSAEYYEDSENNSNAFNIIEKTATNTTTTDMALYMPVHRDQVRAPKLNMHNSSEQEEQLSPSILTSESEQGLNSTGNDEIGELNSDDYQGSGNEPVNSTNNEDQGNEEEEGYEEEDVNNNNNEEEEYDVNNEEEEE